MILKIKIIFIVFYVFFAFNLSAKNIVIEIIGNDYTDTDVVYSLLENKPESLNIEYSNYMLKQLNQSGLFKNVRVETKTDRYIVYISAGPSPMATEPLPRNPPPNPPKPPNPPNNMSPMAQSGYRHCVFRLIPSKKYPTDPKIGDLPTPNPKQTKKSG